jgi:chaperonin GroES
MIRPIYDKVLIKPDKEETIKDGIIIPETNTQKPIKGIVVAVGSGKLDEATITFFPCEVKKGDIVYYLKDRGVEVDIDGEKHIVMKEENILFYIRN